MTGRRAAGLAAVLAALAAAAVLALAGATRLALRSDWLLGEIDADPGTLFVTFTSPQASLLPGRIRFGTLVVRSQDSNVQWEARLDDVSVDVELVALVLRRFHAKKVRAAELTFRLREKLTRAEATPARSERYPRIAGFEDPPRLDDPPKPPAPVGNPWRVEVDDLRVRNVKEIWIDAWRWDGKGDLSGGFRLKPGVEARVLPSELKVSSGTLRWGRDVVSRDTGGHVAASLPRFDTQKYPGNEVWKIVSGSASLAASLDAVPFLAPEGGGPQSVPGTPGNVRARVDLADGRGTATVEAAGTVRARAGSRILRGRVRARVVASRIDFPGGVVAFDGTRVQVSRAVVEGPDAQPWDGAVEIREAPLALSDGSFQARWTARLADARPLVAFLPGGLPRWLAGLLDLRDFTAAGRLRTAPEFFALSPARAGAGTFSADVDWRRARGATWGAVLVRKGALALGLGLGPSAPSVRLTGAVAWFEEEGRPGGLRTDQPRVSVVAPRESR